MTSSDGLLRPDRPHGADLSDLVPGSPSVPITGVTLASNSVRVGDLYLGLPGANTHGARFAGDAEAAGAAAVITDADGLTLAGDLSIPVVVADDPRAHAGEWAAQVYGNPATRLTTFAITGTNGKTTTAYLLSAALRAAGRSVGTIGTIGAFHDDEQLPLPRSTVTTPDAPDLQALLAVLVERGADAVVMEVSSHALALRRAAGIQFDVAAFTNLGHDHLDFHATQDDYFESKALLFTPQQCVAAVISVDDTWGQRLADRVSAAGVPLATVGSQPEATFTIVNTQPWGTGEDILIDTPQGPLDVHLALPGHHNVRNAVTATAMLALGGVDLTAALPGLAQVTVPGRLEVVPLGEAAPTVYVDFAHTPQAVEAVLSSVNHRRTICVLGCGGDRDREKRAPMGAVAVAGSDLVVVTDDNPRSEDPATIRQQVLAGAEQARRDAAPGSRAAQCEVVDGGERSRAIGIALAAANPGDTVAILGKGHEHGQEIGGTVTPFNDVTVVGQQWQRLVANKEG